MVFPSMSYWCCRSSIKPKQLGSSSWLHATPMNRSPPLDELGLLSALSEQAAHYSQFNGMHIALEAPECLPPLPAAVEVAAYRIVLEALTNVVYHAQATRCRICLSLSDVLTLEILDDGVGLSGDHRAGVGMTSMRERAEE